MICKLCDSTPVEVKHFTNTWLSGERIHVLYPAYRWGLAVLFVAGLVQSIHLNTHFFLDRDEEDNVYKYFIYLTNNGRVITCMAFCLEAGIVTAVWRRQKKGMGEPDYSYEPEGRKLPFWYWVTLVLSNTNCVLSVMIALVYWIFLHTPVRHNLDFENFSGHLFPALANFIDVFVTSRPWRMVDVLHPILFGIVFYIFSLVYFLLGGTNYYYENYIYDILDWSKPFRTLMIAVAVTALLAVIHALFYGIYRFRCLLIMRYKSEGYPTGIQHENSKTVLVDPDCCKETLVMETA